MDIDRFSYIKYKRPKYIIIFIFPTKYIVCGFVCWRGKG